MSDSKQTKAIKVIVNGKIIGFVNLLESLPADQYAKIEAGIVEKITAGAVVFQADELQAKTDDWLDW